MAESFLIPVELQGVLMDADWIYRTRGFLTRGVAITRQLKSVKAGRRQVMMNYGAQRRYLTSNLVYKTWPCLLEWDGTLVSNPRTRYRAEVDRNLLCYILGFYSINIDHNGQPELDENNKPQVTYNETALDTYLSKLKKSRTYTLVLCYDYEEEGEFFKSLDLPLPKQM